jgi:hypothetical protein
MEDLKMNKAQVKKDFIPITAVQMMRILNHSGIKFVNLRTGNKYHSTRKTCIPNYNQSKKYWPVVIFSYSSVEDPEGYSGRNLEVSEIYLNPDYKHLLEA